LCTILRPEKQLWPAYSENAARLVLTPIANSRWMFTKVGVRSLFTLAAVLLAQWSLPAAAQSSAPLQMAPLSPWTVDYAEDSCVLRRSFAVGADQTVLELRSFGMRNVFEITVAGRTISGSSRSVRTRFEPDDAYYSPTDAVFLSAGELPAVRFTDSFREAAFKGGPTLETDWPDAERDAREHSITALTVAGIASRDLTFQIGAMGQPMAALRSCVDDLLTQVGVDPAVQRSLSRRARPIDQMAWARRLQRNLPPAVLRAGRSGRAFLRLLLGPDGKPTTCAPLRTSGAAGFPEYACDTTLKYARYEPALDANGQPVGTVVFSTVLYSSS
jgi:hypothetical protein